MTERERQIDRLGKILDPISDAFVLEQAPFCGFVFSSDGEKCFVRSSLVVKTQSDMLNMAEAFGKILASVAEEKGWK